MSAAQILVVEDEAIIAKGLKRNLEAMGYSVPVTASSGKEAIAKAEDMHPNLVLMDIVLQGEMDGVQAAEEIRSRLDVPVIYLTAYGDDQTLARAKVTQPFGYLLKPFKERDLLVTIEMALYKHEMEQRLKAAEQWLASTLLSIADAVIATDARLCIRLMNPIAEAATGCKSQESFGRELSEVLCVTHMDSSTVVHQLASKAIQEKISVPLPEESQLIARNGKMIPVEGSMAPIHDDEGELAGVVLAFRDVSERRQLETVRQENESYRRQSEKMEAVSRLAGGVAHDFNNLLTAILGNTSLARAHLPQEHPCVELLKEAEAAAERAAQRVQQLLGISGKSFLSMKPTILTGCLRELERLVRRTGLPYLAVEFLLADDLWLVQADPAQIREALLILCLNAQEAMPTGGRLTLHADNVVIQESADPRSSPGEYVRLQVQDTGSGIRPEVRSRLFEPFLTTKEPGRGLGLALVLGIVQQHHGWIDCTSQVGQGTRFDVYLPRYCHPLLPAAAPLAVTRSQRNSTTTILLADDEPTVRELGRRILEKQGYQVILADDGAEAVQLFQENRHLIDLVILDLTMPRLSGIDACRRMWEIDPGVRVLLSSGYCAEDLSREQDHVLGFIQKPYHHDELVHSVRAGLEQAGVPRRDILLMLIKRLEQAMAADRSAGVPAWVERVALVLDRVELEVRQHVLEVETGDQTRDAPLANEPTRSRRIEALQKRYASFLDQAVAIKQEMLLKAQTLSCASDPDLTPIDLTAIHQRLGRFREALEQHRLEEIDLLLDAVGTDFGGGD